MNDAFDVVEGDVVIRGGGSMRRSVDKRRGGG
jgi:hypothetical protein